MLQDDDAAIFAREEDRVIITAPVLPAPQQELATGKAAYRHRGEKAVDVDIRLTFPEQRRHRLDVLRRDNISKADAVRLQLAGKIICKG
jgi:hypothetical protein